MKARSIKRRLILELEFDSPAEDRERAAFAALFNNGAICEFLEAYGFDATHIREALEPIPRGLANQVTKALAKHIGTTGEQD